MYGLIGRTLTHSHSARIHALLGAYEYRLISLAPDELEGFLKAGRFSGLNVTIPYKQAVIPYCSELSAAARRIGSVNTILRRPDGSLFGDNTDYDGFLAMAQQAGASFAGKKALIFGGGGTSLTAAAAIRDQGGEALVVSRRGETRYGNLSEHTDAEIIVNATPLGMYPETAGRITDLSQFPRCSSVLDVVYNPFNTRLLMQAGELGIPHAGGFRMLVAQARRASELFQGKRLPDGCVDSIERELIHSLENLVLIGMPGSGKTTVGRLLADTLGLPFLDVDALVVQETGMSIPSLFARQGEEAFRASEAAVIARLGRETRQVIATGGGAVLTRENCLNLKQNGRLIFLARDIGSLDAAGRPLSRGAEALRRLYDQRLPLYARYADLTVDNNGGLSDTLTAILEGIR